MARHDRINQTINQPTTVTSKGMWPSHEWPDMTEIMEGNGPSKDRQHEAVKRTRLRHRGLVANGHSDLAERASSVFPEADVSAIISRLTIASAVTNCPDGDGPNVTQ
jgi:hypothetical protein